MKIPLNKSVSNMYEWVTHTINFIKGWPCPHKCEYCLPAETNILMGDFSVKKISEIKEGDVIFGLKTKIKKMIK
ncbi:MAG: hypothetical protein KKF46_01960 [Nanoarchaeota archaeon]|nr:hypothetical protein [Nanoarchaeota archaeon]MBU1321098.1 hypothetical protein [Nanoarchaeota archaeon]MBU1597307.1 hypothetical protein [Nanoarchaeota archaeon]MBU2441146.1 hypothetical protein [Nanoarchaeota archaeon]